MIAKPLIRLLNVFYMVLVVGLPLSPAFSPGIAEAQGPVVLQNTATGGANGAPLLDATATVRLSRLGSAVSDALAEITPNLVIQGATGVSFTQDILPTINPGDEGVTRIEIVVPAGLANAAITGAAVGGAPLVRNDPTPGPGEFAVTVSGSHFTVVLGTAVTTSLTRIGVTFTADAAGPPGMVTSLVMLPGTADMDTARAGDADLDPSDANSLDVLIRVVADPNQTTVTANPASVLNDGVAASTITVTVRDSGGNPLAGHGVVLSTSRGVLDILTQPAALTDAQGVAVGFVRSTTAGVTRITATDTTDNVTAVQEPDVIFGPGQLLALTKEANRGEAVIGDVITYSLLVQNPSAVPVTSVFVEDTLPPHFKFLSGSARRDGAVMADPTGNRTLVFDLGTVPASTLTTIRYDVVVGAGAEPGEYTNTAVARDVCAVCTISNEARAVVQLVPDPVFDLGTIVGKVYLDRNTDGDQDQGEPGVGGAMVALDDGTYALTDDDGRFHFPAATPGHRLVKLNLLSLPGDARATTEVTRVLWITPALLARVSFGVLYEEEALEIGADAPPGVAVTGSTTTRPLEVHGDIEGMQLVVNDERLVLPGGDVTLRGEGLGDVIELSSGKLTAPLVFQTRVDRPPDVVRWRLRVWGDGEAPLHEIAGEKTPPPTVTWNGRYGPKSTSLTGGVFEYQIEVTYGDGTTITSPRRLFGVNQRSFVSLNLRGSAFVTGSAVLSPSAETALSQAAAVMRQHPGEQVLIEGHTDDVGEEEINMALARARAEAAATYLTAREAIPTERLRVLAFGETRPVAPNDTPEGREQNRRVEIHGEVQALERARLANPYRTAPEVRLEGAAVTILPEGRFTTQVADSTSSLDITIQDAQGRRVETAVPVPSLEITAPRGESRVPLREAVAGLTQDTQPPPVTVDLAGRTEPGNTVEVDGRAVPVAENGSFHHPVVVSLGTHTYGVLSRNPEGVSRIVNLTVTVAARDTAGHMVTVGDPVPELVVYLPAAGTTLGGPTAWVRGTTSPENRVTVNGQATAVTASGSFRAAVDLPPGRSTLRVQVTDPEGHRGEVSREVERGGDKIFLLALADGVVGQMKVSGNLEGSGQDEVTETFTEGRVAYYLKGRIAGKYLITSSFDTGRDEFDNLFRELDDAEAGRLFRNLDPDRFYPIYGDESQVVYDTESQGKFYLAVDSEDLGFLVGNYEASLDGAELARYQRAGYGAQFVYHSKGEASEGEPRTRVTAFGMDGEQVHARTELAATGGSLYYLRHRDVVEGSEFVSLLVRDKNTGLILSRTAQARNVDYRIKYPEGRITFFKQIPSVMEGGSLVDLALLSGHPVFVQVEYETREGAGDATAAGGRVEQALGKSLRVGGTFVRDERGDTDASLGGVDIEAHLGEHSRVVAEYARSDGLDSLTFLSDDGGLTYRAALPGDRDRGEAWKVGADLDPGSWFGSPGRVEVGGYVRRAEPGFSSSANLREEGSYELGARLAVEPGAFGRFVARHHHEERLLPGAPGEADLTKLTSLGWSVRRDSVGLTLEFQDRRVEDAAGTSLNETQVVAGEVRARLTDALEASLEHQNTLSGPENDQTTLGASVRIDEHLTAEASGTVGDRGEAAQGTLRATVGETELYVSERVARDEAGPRTSTVLGAEQALGRDTRVYTEYQWERHDGEDRTVSLVGAERTMHFGRSLRFLLTGEHARTEGEGGETRRSALGGGMVYENPAGVALRSRAEIRTEEGFREVTQFLTAHQLEIRLHPDLSLIGRYRLSRTEDDLANVDLARFEEQSVGLAYRPIAHDRVNALLSWTRLEDEEPRDLARTPVTRSVSDVASGEGVIEITPRVELVEKIAVKWKQDEAGSAQPTRTQTLLQINRLNVRLWRRLDLGTEYRLLRQREAQDQRSGWLNELTWGVNPYLRLGVGYNFTDFSDDEFSDNDYSVRGWFARIQGKY